MHELKKEGMRMDDLVRDDLSLSLSLSLSNNNVLDY